MKIKFRNLSVPDDLKNEVCKVLNLTDFENYTDFNNRAKLALAIKYLHQSGFYKNHIANSLGIDKKHVYSIYESFKTYEKIKGYKELFESIPSKIEGKVRLHPDDLIIKRRIPKCKIDMILRAAGIRKNHLTDSSPLIQTAKRVCYWILYEKEKYSITEIADNFVEHYSPISKAIKTYNFLLQKDKLLKEYCDLVYQRYDNFLTLQRGYNVGNANNN